MKTILKNLALALVLLFPFTSYATSPEEQTKLFYQYVDASEWNKIADLLNESALHEFKAKLLPLLNHEATNGRNGLLKRTFGKNAKFEDAQNATDKVFFVNVISNVAGLIRNSGIKNTHTTVIGEVMEGDDVMHVLVRERYKLGDMEITNIEVLSYKKINNNWAMLLSGKIRGLVQTLQTSMYQLQHRKKGMH